MEKENIAKMLIYLILLILLLLFAPQPDWPQIVVGLIDKLV